VSRWRWRQSALSPKPGRVVRGRSWRHSRKAWRRRLTGSKRWDPACRNHGSCDWCLTNRTIAALRAAARAAVSDDPEPEQGSRYRDNDQDPEEILNCLDVGFPTRHVW